MPPVRSFDDRPCRRFSVTRAAARKKDEGRDMTTPLETAPLDSSLNQAAIQRLTIRDVLATARMFGSPELVRELMETPLDRIVDRLRAAADVSDGRRTIVVDARSTVVSIR